MWENWCRVGSLNSHYMCMRHGYAARKARTIIQLPPAWPICHNTLRYVKPSKTRRNKRRKGK